MELEVGSVGWSWVSAHGVELGPSASRYKVLCKFCNHRNIDLNARGVFKGKQNLV